MRTQPGLGHVPHPMEWTRTGYAVNRPPGSKPLVTTGKERLEVGETIHKTIGVMIVMVARAAEERSRRHDKALEAMHTPLEIVV